jgi:hypothetical protein
MPEPPMISREQIADALRRSGYLIEYRIEDVLRSQGYHVSANTTYPDPITRKPREIDLSAIIAENASSREKDWVFGLCVIECVNNPYPLAFFTKEPEIPTVHVYDLLISGLPAHVRRKGGKSIVWSQWSRISEYLRMQEYHHHCAGRIATQYCSFAPKKGTRPVEWMASHEEGHFESFGKLCAAIDHDIGDHFTNTIPLLNDRVNLEIYYPIVVVGGELLDVRHTEDSMAIEAVDHIHYVQSWIAADKERRYHVDVVTERFFPQLISLIRDETKEFAKRAKENKAALRKSIDMMAKAAKASPEELQTIIRPRHL